MKNRIGGNQNRIKDFKLHIKICVGFDRILSKKVPLYIFRLKKLKYKQLQKREKSKTLPF